MTICAVVGCKSSNDKRRLKNPENIVEYSFCRFPRDEQLRNIWLLKCGRKLDCKAKRLFVYIKHFKPEDYMRNLRHELLNYYPKSSRKVKIDAIPSLFLPDYVQNIVFPPINTLNSKVKDNQVPRKALNSSATTSKTDLTLPSENFIITINDPTLQENQTIAQPPSPSSSDGDPNGILIESVDVQAIQFEFIDHVVMVYLNRCRSRAGDSNVGMPHYILKRKAQEAAVLLGTRHEDRFHWIEKFKKKIAEHDAKGVVLTSEPESLSIADIISEEWPKFAKLKNLDIGEDSEETTSALDEEEYSRKQEENMTIEIIENDQTQSIEPAPNCSISESISSVIEQTYEIAQTSPQKQNNRATKKAQQHDPSQDEFLKHILRVFIRRFNATWPLAEMPDIILHAKFREAATSLGSKIKKRNVWLRAFKRSLKRISLSETIFAEPNQSLDIDDIIEEERPKFYLENDITSVQGQELIEEVITMETNTVDISEQNNVESSDTIQTYEEARDCLNLINSYAMELGDYSALSLIKQVDSFLRSDDCKD